MIDKIKNHWEILVILFLGLTPLLWYKNPNSLALGHDMGFPINPIVFFQDRVFLWTDRVGFGWDQTLGSAAILIHGFEALIASLGLSIFEVQKIVFIFWFLLPGLAMYCFISIFYKGKEQWFIRLSASLSYMFNHFLLQGWFIAERTKISLFVALPLLLGLVLSIIEKKISVLKGLALMSLVFFFFNGGGGLPLYGGLLLTLTLGFLFFGFIQLRESGKSELKRLFLVAIGILTSFILANFYWILPIFIKSFSSYAQNLSSIGGISGVLAWSFEISRFASILNVMRLQGIPDWYDNPQHPFSGLFLNNQFLILISFLIPAIVFSSLFLIKKTPQHRRYIVFFNMLAILGIIFTAGSHPPFGVIYNFFLTFIPGFAIFRTPFYKFAPALWFAYAYLFAFSLYFLTEKINSLRIKTGLRIVILASILAYSFPFFTGSFFNWRAPFSTMTTLPPYILDFGKWADTTLTFNDRVLTFPQQNLGWNTAIYKWGYWSTAPAESLLTNKSIITNDKVMSAPEKKLIEKIYASILDGTNEWEKPANILGIDYFLLHNDFYSDAPKFETDSPSLFKGRFSELGLNKKNTFGQWDIYELPKSKEKIYVESQPILILESNDLIEDQFVDINSFLDIPGNSGFYLTSDRQKLKNEVFSKNVLIEKCLFCDKEDKKLTLFLPKATVLPGSIFYPLSKAREGRQREIFSTNINSQVDFFLGTTLKRISEIRNLTALKRDEKTIITTIEDLNSEIEALSNVLKKMDKTSFSSKLLILRTNNFLRDENRIIGVISNNSTGNTFDSLIALSSNIARVYNDNQRFEYRYPTDNEKVFFFTLDLTSEWEILLKNEETGEKINVKDFQLNGKTVKLKGKKLNTYSSFGKMRLPKGENEFKFTLEDSPNLLEETGKPTDFTINPAKTDCHDFTLNNIRPSKIYNLKFDYAKEGALGSDIGPFVYVEQIIKGETLNSRFLPKASSTFQTFESKLTTSSRTEALKISICPVFGFEDSSTLYIKDLSLRNFAIPTAILISDNGDLAPKPNISVEQRNQVKYIVSVKGAQSPYILTLNNNFSPSWELGFPDDSKLGTDKHIKVNGYANGWIIDKKGDYVLEITYGPQKYFYWGFIITAIFMISTVFYAIYKRNKN